MVDEQALVDGLKPGHLAAAGLASFGSQAGSHEHVGMRLAADIVTAKVLLEGWVRTSTGRPGRHGMQEVREFDSPRLHQPTNLRGAVNTGSSDFRGPAASAGVTRSWARQPPSSIGDSRRHRVRPARKWRGSGAVRCHRPR